MFGMIRHTEAVSGQRTVVAYRDNASVMEGGTVRRWLPEAPHGPSRYAGRDELVHVLMKVETHNHPTAISPFPGAATGAGGEIRDEGATGRGSRPKAGLTGFAVSNLHLPGSDVPWEASAGCPASASGQPAGHHGRRAGRGRVVQQRVRSAGAGRLLPGLRAVRRRCPPRLPQADHERRRRGDGLGVPGAQGDLPARQPAGPARRSRHADRDGRRRGELDGLGSQRGRAGLRLGPAGQPRDPAACPGGGQPLLGVGRAQPDPLDPRRRRGRAVQRVPRARRRRRARRPLRPAPDPRRGKWPGAEGAVVQREPGAVRPRRRAGVC